MEKQLSLTDAINFVLKFDDYNEQCEEYDLLYQLAIIARDSKAAAAFFKAKQSLIPGKEIAKLDESIKKELLKKLVFPHSFKYAWGELSAAMQDVVEQAIELGNVSAINTKALALANQCPCTGWSSLEGDPSNAEDVDSLKCFVSFASKYIRNLRKDILWLLNHATAEKRRSVKEMDFSISDLKKSAQAPSHATSEEWQAYRDMIRLERSYSKRLEALEHVDYSPLNKHICAQLLHHKRSIVTFTGNNQYRIEKDRCMDHETGKILYAIAAAEGCHNSRWNWE